MRSIVTIVSCLIATGYIVGYTDNYIIAYPAIIIAAVLLVDIFLANFIAIFSKPLSQMVDKFGLNHNVALGFVAGIIIGISGTKFEEYESFIVLAAIAIVGFVFSDTFSKLKDYPTKTKALLTNSHKDD